MQHSCPPLSAPLTNSYDICAVVQVAAALSREARERLSVGALKRRLVRLQAEVAAAHERLRMTQARRTPHRASLLHSGIGAGVRQASSCRSVWRRT